MKGAWYMTGSSAYLREGLLVRLLEDSDAAALAERRASAPSKSARNARARGHPQVGMILKRNRVRTITQRSPSTTA